MDHTHLRARLCVWYDMSMTRTNGVLIATGNWSEIDALKTPDRPVIEAGWKACAAYKIPSSKSP